MAHTHSVIGPQFIFPNISNMFLLSFSCKVMSDSLRPHGLQHARLLCPSPPSRACSNSCSLSRWCHPTISSSDTLFSSFPNLSQHQDLFQWVLLIYLRLQQLKATCFSSEISSFSMALCCWSCYIRCPPLAFLPVDILLFFEDPAPCPQHKNKSPPTFSGSQFITSLLFTFFLKLYCRLTCNLVQCVCFLERTIS